MFTTFVLSCPVDPPSQLILWPKSGSVVAFIFVGSQSRLVYASANALLSLSLSLYIYILSFSLFALLFIPLHTLWWMNLGRDVLLVFAPKYFLYFFCNSAVAFFVSRVACLLPVSSWLHHGSVEVPKYHVTHQHPSALAAIITILDCSLQRLDILGVWSSANVLIRSLSSILIHFCLDLLLWSSTHVPAMT